MARATSAESVFTQESSVAPLRLIAMRGTEELGAKIDHYLTQWAKGSPREEESFLIEAECPRFASGDAKGLLKASVRGDDLFILVDTGNYSCKYNMFSIENSMSPDDHFQDLKRIIQAASGKAHRITVIMPVLYGGRQHKRSYRESLDCAMALQELKQMGVANVLTFDAHDPRVMNAIPLMGFDNIVPSYQLLKSLLRSFPDIRLDKDHMMVVSPDEGAISRNMFYASVLGIDLGMYYKRRDYSVIINGRNPIVAHEYMGTSVAGKDVFVADDIISSGDSMLDIAYKLKKENARRIFTYATYPLFTNGLEAFDKAYEDGIFDAVFGTNLTYRTDELRSRPWYKDVDISKYIAYYIAAVNHDISLSQIIDPGKKVQALIENHNLEIVK